MRDEMFREASQEEYNREIVKAGIKVGFLEAKFDRLETLVKNLIKMYGMDKAYTSADINGCRATDSSQTKDIALNASDIADNRTGIEESFEISLVNTDDIADLRTALEEVYEIVIEE